MSKIKFFILVFILILAFFLRIYGISWDNGYHLHPDERMLIMVTEKINYFKNLNPDFFNYGSLPIYILRLISPNGGYDSLLITGRIISSVFELITIFFIYLIANLLFKSKNISLLSGFFYSIAFFPIQNSHFFVVDVFVTTYSTILIYILLILLLRSAKNNEQQSNITLIILIGITYAAMVATKFTAIIYYLFIVGVIFWNYFKKFKNLITYLLIFNFSFLTFNFLFMPYAYLNYPKFFSDIKLQLKMNSNPYIFPYTLQYVGSLPYLYYLKNIFLWGLGPFISILTLFGILILKIKNSIKNENFKIIITFVGFYLFYFLIVGRSSVKFMRYILPMYPFFAIMAGFGLQSLLTILLKQGYSFKIVKLIIWIILLLNMFWSFSFISIYSQPHTRISATEWILKNIPAGSTLAVEHWDDRLPIYGSNKYLYEELTLYEQPDDINKWKTLNEKLLKSDYIIIASNRLYVPLQKLSDCKKYKYCYPKTAKYYNKLFKSLPIIPKSDKEKAISFRKVAEFTVYPKLEFAWISKLFRSDRNWKLEIRDDTADESFTVYDHPKIMIFKKYLL